MAIGRYSDVERLGLLARPADVTVINFGVYATSSGILTANRSYELVSNVDCWAYGLARGDSPDASVQCKGRPIPAFEPYRFATSTSLATVGIKGATVSGTCWAYVLRHADSE